MKGDVTCNRPIDLGISAVAYFIVLHTMHFITFLFTQ